MNTTPSPAPSPTPLVQEAACLVTGDALATVFAALLAAGVVVLGYFIQQAFARKERRAKVYSDALRAVEDYMEAPFLIRRRDRRRETQLILTTHISEVQSRLAYFEAELQIQSKHEIAAAYSELIKAARAEAGPAMSEAWRSSPTAHGRQVPLGARFSRHRTDAARVHLISLMRSDTRPAWSRN